MDITILWRCLDDDRLFVLGNEIMETLIGLAIAVLVGWVLAQIIIWFFK